MTFKIYTKTGDTGETGLFGGQRVSKNHIRVETYGTLDELNSILGLARASLNEVSFTECLDTIQSLLFELGAMTATPPSKQTRNEGLQEQDITFLEETIDCYEAQLQPLRSFILPGGCMSAGYLHLARTVCRRAERLYITLCSEEPETASIGIVFLNRLSDLLFVLARAANQNKNISDIAWQPRLKK